MVVVKDSGSLMFLSPMVLDACQPPVVVCAELRWIWGLGLLGDALLFPSFKEIGDIIIRRVSCRHAAQARMPGIHRWGRLAGFRPPLSIPACLDMMMHGTRPCKPMNWVCSIYLVMGDLGGLYFSRDLLVQL